MAVPKLEKEHLHMIPEFSGEVELLPEFISTTSKIVEYFYDNVNVNNFQNFVLLNTIKTKIKGQAKLNISSHQCDSWEQIKGALLSTYEDRRDTYTLRIELCNAKLQELW
uniref:Uncharacterized protein n=1 Tax=Cacopsylla melanoneura TaxID=428564 RepID=A0A8D8ZPH4_9HEMI